MKLNTKHIALIAALLLTADRALAGCGAQTASAEVPPAPAALTATPAPTGRPPAAGVHFTDSSDGGHAILADGEAASYANITVTKTGEAEGEGADLHGDNAAVLAVNGAQLTLRAASVTTDGCHANAVFSCGEGTVVNIADAAIRTSGSGSGGLMTAGGGTMSADNVVVHTAGGSSAAIRTDPGSGTVTVTGGTYKTDGAGSPAICAAADICVTDAELSTSAAQGVVAEGPGAVKLENVTLTAGNTEKNDKSPWYQAVMLYQSVSGDEAGTADFTMLGGSLTNLQGDIFFVTNTRAVINLTGVDIVNDDPAGVFLRAAAADWGREGENGGHVDLHTAAQRLDGDLLADRLSSLNLYLTDGSALTGAVNPTGEGAVSVSLTDGASWTLTGDSRIDSLRCEADSIRLNGHSLYVNGVPYAEGRAMEGGPAASA